MPHPEEWSEGPRLEGRATNCRRRVFAGPAPRRGSMVSRMKGFFFVLILIAMLITLAVLATGIIGMARGGDFNAKYGNKLMRARVIAQGVALALFALAVLAGAQD